MEQRCAKLWVKVSAYPCFKLGCRSFPDRMTLLAPRAKPLPNGDQ